MKLDDNKLRVLVLARITKGDAFRLSGDSYVVRQSELKECLDAMSREEIFTKYPLSTYDIKR